MKKVTTAFLFVCLALFASLRLCAQESQNWSYDFEDAKKAIGDQHKKLELTLNGLKWVSYSLRCNGDADDYVDGKGSARIYGEKSYMKEMPYLQLKENKPGGIGTVSFDYRAYKKHAQKQIAWILEVSEDGGTTWSPVGNSFTPSMEVSQFSRRVNVTEGLVRIIRADYSSFDLKNGKKFQSAFNIDNLAITDYEEEEPTQPVLKFNEPEIVFGEMHKGESKTLKAALTYKNLVNQAITINIAEAGKAFFSVQPTTFTPEEPAGVLELEITCSPSSLGEIKSSLAVVCGELSAELQLSAKVVREKGVYIFGGGDGTQESPYLISAPEHLWELSTGVDEDKNTFAGKYFKQTADIDMSNYKNMTPIGTNFGVQGTNNRYFSGHYDGGGHKVSKLTLEFNGKNYIGVALFGSLKNARIEHLTLSDSRIKADAIVGGITAAIIGSHISDCHVEKDVTITATKHSYAGGIACGAFGEPSTIEKCTSAATIQVTSSMGAGGILAVNSVQGSSISKCVNMGSIYTRSGQIAGIVGYIEDGPITIQDCANTGKISSEGSVACGIAGLLQPGIPSTVNIAYCYNAAIVEGTDEVFPITVGAVDDSQTFNLKNNYYNGDVYKITSDKPLYGEAMTAAEMKSETLLKKLNLGRDFYPWEIFEGKNDGFPLPFGDGSWQPTATKAIEVVEALFCVVNGKLIVPEGMHSVAVYAMDGTSCSPEQLTQGACYIVRAINSKGESVAQKIVIPLF